MCITGYYRAVSAVGQVITYGSDVVFWHGVGGSCTVSLFAVHVNLTVCVLLTSSHEDTVDVQTERKTIIIPSRKQPKPPAANDVQDVSSTDDDGSKVSYYPSETCRLVQERDSGVQSNVSPLTGVEIKTNQSKRLMMLDHSLP